MTPNFYRLVPLALLSSALLAACGGSDDPASPSAGGAGTLTISAATPAAQATTVDLSTATAKGNMARAADGFSAVPYCELFWENANGANGKKYALQVYFRQSDKLPINVSVIEIGSGWVLSSNDAGAPLTGMTVDTATKTLVFTNKAMSGMTTERGTLAGNLSFPANVGTAACGT